MKLDPDQHWGKQLEPLKINADSQPCLADPKMAGLRNSRIIIFHHINFMLLSESHKGLEAEEDLPERRG